MSNVPLLTMLRWVSSPDGMQLRTRVRANGLVLDADGAARRLWEGTPMSEYSDEHVTVDVIKSVVG
jgi:hypothetical protein